MNNKLTKLKKEIGAFVYSMATYISPYFNTQLRFIKLTGKTGNLKRPETFSEKLSWLKLNYYSSDPLVKKCADKYKVRDYISESGLDYILNPLYGIYKNSNEIIWSKLPQQFVLKWNYGCGYNIFCHDKDSMDENTVKKQLDKWRKKLYWPIYAEKQYYIEEKIITCERYMQYDDEDGLLDYKFYCFHGKVLAILVISRVDVDGNGNKAIFMTPDWNILSDIPARYQKTLMPDRPQTLQEMIQIAEKLSQPFPFVRVDLYEYENQPVFGEMTFTPATGILPSEAPIDGKPMGDYIDLSSLINKEEKV